MTISVNITVTLKIVKKSLSKTVRELRKSKEEINETICPRFMKLVFSLFEVEKGRENMHGGTSWKPLFNTT